LGIKLSFPSIAASIPFELDIKSKLLQNLARVEKIALALVGGFSIYFSHRGDLVKKHGENPNIEDYLEFLRNMDSEGLSDLKIWLRKLTFIQLAIQESLFKNFLAESGLESKQKKIKKKK